MQPLMVQCSTHSIVQYGTVQYMCNALQYSTVQHSTVSDVQYTTMQQYSRRCHTLYIVVWFCVYCLSSSGGVVFCRSLTFTFSLKVTWRRWMRSDDSTHSRLATSTSSSGCLRHSISVSLRTTSTYLYEYTRVGSTLRLDIRQQLLSNSKNNVAIL